MSTTLQAGAGNAGVYLNASGDVFYSGAKFDSAATATLRGGTGGYNPNTFGSPGGTLSGNGGDGVDILNGATLDNLSNGNIYAGVNGKVVGIDDIQSGIGVRLDGGTLNNAGIISSDVGNIDTKGRAGVYIAANGDNGTRLRNGAREACHG